MKPELDDQLAEALQTVARWGDPEQVPDPAALAMRSVRSQGRVDHGRGRMLAFAAAFAAVVAVGAIWFAVSDDSQVVRAGEPSTGAEQPTSGDGLDLELNSAWLALLRIIPDDAEFRGWVSVDDFERARAQAGLVLPAGASDAEVLEVLSGIPGMGSHTAVFSWSGTNAADMRREFGFWFDEITATVYAGVPINDVAGFAVTTDPATIDRAVRTDPAWSGDLTDTTYAGVAYYQWGPDGEMDPARSSGARPVGHGGQLALVGGVAIRTRTDDTMRAALEANADRSSLADDAQVLAVVAALDRSNVHAFTLIDPGAPDTPTGATAATIAQFSAADPDNVTAEELAAAEALLSAQPPPLLGYQWLGVGQGFADGQAINVIVFAHGDEAAATANGARFRDIIENGGSYVSDTRWADLYQVRSSKAEGNLTIALLEVRSGPLNLAEELLASGESIFQMEP